MMAKAERCRSLARPSERMRISSQTASPKSLNRVGGRDGIVMLPNVDRHPTHVLQGCVSSTVSLPVPGQFCFPPGSIVLGRHIVNRTAMPEASVDEDCQLRLSKGDVRSAWKSPELNAIPKTPPMQLAAQGEFRLGISSGHARELAAHGLVQGRRPSDPHVVSLPLGGGS